MPRKTREGRAEYMRLYRARKRAEREARKLRNTEFKRNPLEGLENKDFSSEEYHDLLNVDASIIFDTFDIWRDVEAERDLSPSEKYKKEGYGLANEQKEALEKAI